MFLVWMVRVPELDIEPESVKGKLMFGGIVRSVQVIGRDMSRVCSLDPMALIASWMVL